MTQFNVPFVNDDPFSPSSPARVGDVGALVVPSAKAKRLVANLAKAERNLAWKGLSLAVERGAIERRAKSTEKRLLDYIAELEALTAPTEPTP